MECIPPVAIDIITRVYYSHLLAEGPCLTEVGPGGHIPKSLYLPVDEQKEDDGVLSTMYTTTSFVKGCPIEVSREQMISKVLRFQCLVSLSVDPYALRFDF